jgi:hypothetical protein
LEQAPVEQRIIQQCTREGLPLPKKIANAPQLGLGLELYYDAFLELNSCRASGWGLMPIPWSAIRDYAETFDLDEEQFEDLYYYVRVMDTEFMKWHATHPGTK